MFTIVFLGQRFDLAGLRIEITVSESQLLGNPAYSAPVIHLIQTQYITLAHAKVEAAKAVGAMNGSATFVRFDIEQSTHRRIFITHEGETHAITIVDGPNFVQE